MLFILLFSFVVECRSQIPAARIVDWTMAGLQDPKPEYSRLIDITTVGGVGNGITQNDAALQQAIASLGADSGIIYFPAGTYFFILPIQLRSGLVLRGQDASSTTLLFNLFGRNDLISISGNRTGQISGVPASATKNNNFAIVQNPSFFSQGDYVKLFQNDSAFVLDIFQCVGQILMIKYVSGDTVYFHSQLRRDYVASDNPRLQKLAMVSGSGVECLKIKRLDSTAAQYGNITFDYAAKCWVKGVESDSTNFAHISLSNSTNVEITGSYFHGSFSYGPGGQGYGIACNRTTGECLIENNIFRHLRHSMLVQSGSNGNVFTYNYSREPYKSESAPNDLAGDIVLHGNYPYANLFEGNIVQNIVSDASHLINGPYNTFFRNRAEAYGILYSTGSGDSSNIVGNEMTSTLPNQGNYLIKGVGNFEYGNNVKGTILPAGTDTVGDGSYYYAAEPYFWPFATSWPSIGWPNLYNTRSIPAKARYGSGMDLTICPPHIAFPLHSISLKGSKENNKNLLTWTMGNQSEPVRFYVERRAGSAPFSTIRVMVSTGDNYNYFNDNSPLKGINFYRILAKLPGGKMLYSNTVIINNSSTKTIRIFPDPVKNILNVEVEDGAENTTAMVKNVAGQAFNISFLKSENCLTADVSILTRGVYFVDLKNKKTGQSSIHRFFKN